MELNNHSNTTNSIDFKSIATIPVMEDLHVPAENEQNGMPPLMYSDSDNDDEGTTVKQTNNQITSPAESVDEFHDAIDNVREGKCDNCAFSITTISDVLFSPISFSYQKQRHL
jgi:hypothetical protein